MSLSSDYGELFKILNKHGVRYLVIGAYAVIYYTEPRFTKDLDIWVEAREKNATSLYKALKEFGAPLAKIRPRDFTNRKLIYQIGVDPIRIDIMMGLPGVRFNTAWRKRTRSTYGDVPISILGKKELVRSKRRIGRTQDLMDVERLTRRGGKRRKV